MDILFCCLIHILPYQLPNSIWHTYTNCMHAQDVDLKQRQSFCKCLMDGVILHSGYHIEYELSISPANGWSKGTTQSMLGNISWIFGAILPVQMGYLASSHRVLVQHILPSWSWKDTIWGSIWLSSKSFWYCFHRHLHCSRHAVVAQWALNYDRTDSAESSACPATYEASRG